VGEWVWMNLKKIGKKKKKEKKKKKVSKEGQG